jgi:hypothetical protein
MHGSETEGQIVKDSSERPHSWNHVPQGMGLEYLSRGGNCDAPQGNRDASADQVLSPVYQTVSPTDRCWLNPGPAPNQNVSASERGWPTPGLAPNQSRCNHCPCTVGVAREHPVDLGLLAVLK